MKYWDREELTKNILSEDDLVQLTDDEGLGNVNEERVNQAADFATGLVDGALIAGGYTLPLAAAPATLKAIAYALINYALHKRKLKLNMPESLEKDYQNQLKLLGMISDRKLVIGASEDTAAARIKLHDLYEEE